MAHRVSLGVKTLVEYCLTVASAYLLACLCERKRERARSGCKTKRRPVALAESARSSHAVLLQGRRVMQCAVDKWPPADATLPGRGLELAHKHSHVMPEL